ncbi:glycoside hydrolase family protein [Escherichia coli]|nr:glycoside hydrolase family protein [Escherichia coli]MED6699542.1 glycoside hydrolase family protein [Escherichia coli O157]USL83659.1 putative baseplate hub subunit and tail lysozyme [Escherichia phage A4]HCQ0858452.1 glycoside hydrolase family protein [Escherichia coli]
MSKWEIKPDDAQYLKEIKEFEGTIAFQTKLGYFKNGKFRVYKDSLGLDTIGYGHLVLKGENFSAGLTEAEAEALLQKDSLNAYREAKEIYDQFGMTAPIQVQRVLWMMVFQMGKSRVLNFKKAMAALGRGDYKTAGKEMRDSAWYRQTTSRAEKMARIVESV